MACCAAAVASAAAVVAHLDARPADNLARRARVTTSSEDPRFPEVQRTVDGSLKELGFHTLSEEQPWVLLDLGGEEPISRVVVFNRGDCCIDVAKPLAIEVSRGGGVFEEVSRREVGFWTWDARFSPVTARWIRVKLLRRDVLHLREIEVYR